MIPSPNEDHPLRIQRVAILSPGDMGHAVGRELRARGLEILTCLSGRSARTRRLAEIAGFRNLPTLETLVEQADLILSILVPGAAVALAEAVAKALRSVGRHPIFADCNAISPETAKRIGIIISDADGQYLDASIIGSPPGKGHPPRFYVSGPNGGVFRQLDGRGIAVQLIGDDIGRASAIKMCYAGITKGTMALHAAVLISAAALGLSEELKSELAFSQAQALKAMEQVNRVPAKAFRWIAEMEEIARTFGSVGITSAIHLGAAEVFKMISESNLGGERPETIDQSRTLSQTVSILAESLKQPK